MHDDIRDRLKALLARPDRDELLDDPRRLSELVRERLGSNHRREATILNAVMQEGMPKRLLSMPTTGVTEGTLRSFARKISEDTALKEDAVKSAVETWAVALGYEIRPTAPQTPPPPPPPPPPQGGAGRPTGGRIEAGWAAQAGPRPQRVPSAPSGDNLMVALGIALLVQAVLKLFLTLPYVGRAFGASMNLGVLVFLLTVVIGLASIPVGIGAILRAGWVRPIALVVCAIGAAAYFYIFVRILGSSYAFANLQQSFNTLVNVLGLAVHAGTFARFVRWRPADKTPIGSFPQNR